MQHVISSNMWQRSVWYVRNRTDKYEIHRRLGRAKVAICRSIIGRIILNFIKLILDIKVISYQRATSSEQDVMRMDFLLMPPFKKVFKRSNRFKSLDWNPYQAWYPPTIQSPFNLSKLRRTIINNIGLITVNFHRTGFIHNSIKGVGRIWSVSRSQFGRSRVHTR